MRNFSAMNEVWDAWINPANPPVRAGPCNARIAPDLIGLPAIRISPYCLDV